MSSGYALHLEAYADLDDIRYYLAEQTRTQPSASSRKFLTPFAGS